MNDHDFGGGDWIRDNACELFDRISVAINDAGAPAESMTWFPSSDAPIRSHP